MLWILLLLTPSIVWVIHDLYSQRRYRNVGKHYSGNANWYLRNSDTSSLDGDSGYGSYHDGDCGGFDGDDCGGGDD